MYVHIRISVRTVPKRGFRFEIFASAAKTRIGRLSTTTMLVKAVVDGARPSFGD
jgi:hypothetical protein